IMTVDESDYDPARWREDLRAYEGLGDLLDLVEVVDAYDRTVPHDVSPRDAFIATTWWTAHIAHRAAQQMGSDRFVYLIQEYEPFTFPMGSYAALASQTYE